MNSLLAGAQRKRPSTPAGRKRVLHVGKYYPPHMGGMETHLQELSSGLREHVDLRVVVASDGRDAYEEIVDGVSVARVGTPFHLGAAPICPGLVRAIQDSRADIVHLHLPNPFAVLAYLASGHRGHLVVTYHSDVVRQRVLGPVFEPILRRLLGRCSAIIASTPNYIDSSRVLSGFRDRCRVIPFGIPIEPYSQPDADAVRAIRERHGSRLIVSVGRLVYYKGYEYLIDAMPAVEGRLLIIGEGPLRAALEERIRARGVGDRVVLAGRVDDVIPYFHAADVTVLASIARSEAFGIVQIEAMACGSPVVNTRLDSGVPYVSLDGVTGLTVPPADSGALARALNRLLDDPETRSRFGTAARERARREFSAPVMTERMLQLYESL